MDLQTTDENSISVCWQLPSQQLLILDNATLLESDFMISDTLLPSGERNFIENRSGEFSRALFALLTTTAQNSEWNQQIEALEDV